MKGSAGKRGAKMKSSKKSFKQPSIKGKSKQPKVGSPKPSKKGLASKASLQPTGRGAMLPTGDLGIPGFRG